MISCRSILWYCYSLWLIIFKVNDVIFYPFIIHILPILEINEDSSVQIVYFVKFLSALLLKCL